MRIGGRGGGTELGTGVSYIGELRIEEYRTIEASG